MKFNAEKIQDKMQFLMQHIGQNKYLQSVMRGMMMSAVATLLKVFPIPAYQKFLADHNLVRFFDIVFSVP